MYTEGVYVRATTVGGGGAAAAAAAVQDAVARGEMPSAMARSMDYIYQSGDQPGLGRWYEKSGYAAAVLVLYRVVRSNGVL